MNLSLGYLVPGSFFSAPVCPSGPDHQQVQFSSPQSSSQTGLSPLACAVRPTTQVVSQLGSCTVFLMGPYSNTAISPPFLLLQWH